MLVTRCSVARPALSSKAAIRARPLVAHRVSAARLSAPVRATASLEDDVKKIIVEQLGVKPEDVKNESSFTDDLGADSLDAVELVMALEEEFGTEIPDEEAEKITTVQAAIDFVQSNKK